MEPTLWPARNVAEYAYCPRLFYFMEVEGIHLPSEDTEQGHRVHRRVDHATSEPVTTEDQSKPSAVRSLTLTSERLGLTATLDLAEISGTRAVPVEYRKGRPQYSSSVDEQDQEHRAAQPWPTDRVQVGLQAILLEEAGYQVPEAILYYAAVKQRLCVPVDDALRREALETLQAAKTCAEGPRPLPLVNDARCPRCSLQPICLPDEVNHERGAADAVSPRKIWPPRDDALHLVAQKEGARIGVRGQTLRVTDYNGAVVREVPLAGVESLTLIGSVQVSTQALTALADRSIPVGFCSGAGRLITLLDPLDSVSAEVRRAQVRGFDDPIRCLALSRALVVAKIANQRTLLMRNASSLPKLDADELAVQAQRAAQAASLDAARGHEGQAAAVYFRNFAKMFKDEEIAGEFNEQGRQRRPPPDPVNSVLSFAYTMLTHECVTALRLARLEPTIGALHSTRPGRPALALDLMEPFRPLVADSLAVSAFNRRELVLGHFQRTAAGCAMTSHGRAAFFAAWGRRLDTEVTHPVFGYKLSYRRMIQLHARMIAAWLLGEIPSLSFLTTR